MDGTSTTERRGAQCCPPSRETSRCVVQGDKSLVPQVCLGSTVAQAIRVPGTATTFRTTFPRQVVRHDLPPSRVVWIEPVQLKPVPHEAQSTVEMRPCSASQNATESG